MEIWYSAESPLEGSMLRRSEIRLRVGQTGESIMDAGGWGDR